MAGTFALGGCAFYPQDLSKTPAAGSIPRLDLKDGPIVKKSDKELEVRCKPCVEAPDVTTVKYDLLHWTVAKMVYFRVYGKHSDEWVFLDTGLPEFARVTTDVVAARKLPSALDIKPPLTLVDELRISEKVRFSDFPAIIEHVRWQFRVFGIIPIWQQRGWILGTSFLKSFNYLAFDNRKQTVTFGGGSASFNPSDPEAWVSYPLAIDDNGHTVTTMPVCGVTTRVLADSGGGPDLSVDRTEWPNLSRRLHVLSRRSEKRPTWGDFVDVDIYEVENLQVGVVRKKRATIMVSDQQGMPVVAGLGVFRDTAVVFDFQKNKLWVRK